jgi:2-methylisocitrate lyase-like PEP mutase family enzyme
MADMVRKIEVAADGRSSADVLAIARAEGRTSPGRDEAMRRAYARACADGLFIETPESEDKMASFGAAFHQPLPANTGEGGRTPIRPRARPAQHGFQVAIHPAAGFLATAAVLDQKHRRIGSTGNSLNASVPLFEFSRLTEIRGFPKVHAFERRRSTTR